MKTLNEAQLDALLLGAQIIEEDGYGLKVARLSNGDFLKLYRRKRLFSSALWQPPAETFARNAQRLNRLEIRAPDVIEVLSIPERQLSGVLYQPLPGETLRHHWQQVPEQQLASSVEKFGRFLGDLHSKGVYFRSLHLGNVLQLPDGRFGLIDLSDMHISGRPLPRWKCKRNVRHMLRYQQDAQWLAHRHVADLLRGYAESAGTVAAKSLESAIGVQRRNSSHDSSKTS
ncbi:lipopolysaccharide kinase InaA family protein [Pseudomonas resinovorans]|uniref:Lipopolysaccharide kinase InaA family protein n=1 Tax=Metapseudomonas resinovorans TaxID=53412 RepID=A0ABT4Y8I5_METRE|nr:lipopolysaccharide kinase InaA family protein [Pseudomonas resinovorans]MDA8485031.1 lipopolysaccharide kinase InaA family protein [Pseudomonas resinovorans]